MKKSESQKSESQKCRFLIRLLSVLCAVFLCLFFWGVFRAKAKNTLEHKKTALLNPVNAQKCTELIFSSGGESLTLHKKNGVWLATDNDITFFADPSMVASFFDSLTKTRTVYHVSQEASLLDQYGVTDERAFRICARLEDGTIATDLYFGFESDVAPRIYFRGGKTMNVYQTDNDVYRFLHTENRYWAHQSLFLEGVFSFAKADVVRVLFDGAPLFTGDEVLLDEYLSALQNTRSSVLRNKEELLQSMLLHTIQIECAVHDSFTVKVYAYGENYAVLCENPWYNCFFEVSSWSYERLIPKEARKNDA